MITDYKEWIDKLNELENIAKKIDASLADIRAAKNQLQLSKSGLVDQLPKGQYYRDEERIIISAPEIIIGNLAKDGTLNTNAPSKVIIRSNNISVEGVSLDSNTTGLISQKATLIQNICADPGIDGLEEVVDDTSRFTVQACSIGLQSEDVKNVFTDQPAAGNGEITLTATKKINVKAAMSGKGMANKLESIIKKKEETEKRLKDKYKEKKDIFKTTNEYLTKICKYDDKFLKDKEEIITNCVDLESLQKEMEATVMTLTQQLSECSNIVSQIAEVNRQIKSLKEEKKKFTENATTYEKKSTGSSIDIISETTNIRSMDDDNNIRENDEAGLKIQAKNVTISSEKSDGSVIDKSEINLQSQNIKLSTENSNEEGDNVNFPAEGNIHVVSKNIVMESVDYERKKGEERKEKALAKDGSIKMRAENMELSSYDTEGKASGKFTLNSKNISLKAMDVDKEKLTDKEMAKDSKMLLLTDKIYAGDPEEKSLTQQIQLAADKVGIFAKTTAEIQQDEAKAAVQLDGGNIALSGSKTNLFGETTVNGKTTFKADTVQGKATVDNIEIKTSLKSPKTSEGIAVPSSPSSEKISTKLKEDKDINKQEEKS